MTTRRDVLIGLSASALGMPIRAFAQSPGRPYRIGFLLESGPSYRATE